MAMMAAAPPYAIAAIIATIPFSCTLWPFGHAVMAATHRRWSAIMSIFSLKS